MADALRIAVKDVPHVALLAEWGALIDAKEALAKEGFGKLPGYALAEARITELAAKLEARCMALNLRLCARVGVDIAQVASIQVASIKGAPFLLVNYLDLVDMAEDGPDAR